jgi:hypothetical protein
MLSRAGRITCGFVMLFATGAWAQTVTVTEERGRVVRVEPNANVIVLEDGRMFRVAPNTVLLLDNRPVEMTTLQPGAAVVIKSGEPVMLRDGRYVTVTAPAVAAVPINAARQTLYGQVEDVDKDGEVKIKTPDGSFNMRMSPDAVRGIRKGDTVTLDVTINAPGAAPAASPRTR